MKAKPPPDLSGSEVKGIVLDLLQALDDKGRNMSKGRSQELSDGQQVVVALMIGCVRLSRGIQLLIHRDFPEEAFLLYRTLLMDSTTLAFFHRHIETFEALAANIYETSLREDLALEHEGVASGLSRPPAIRARIERDLIEAVKRREKLGVSRSHRLPQLKEMLRELDALKMYWFYKKASQMVHSNSGLASRLEWDQEGGTVAVRMEGDIDATVQVGFLTSESMMTALVAAGLLLGWEEDVEEFTSMRPMIRAAFSQLLRTPVIEDLIPDY